MATYYQIVDISKWGVLSVEPKGSKPNLWVQETGGTKWLFKHRHRPNVGDDWAEKIASEVAESLAIPHAKVDLCRFGEKRGVISRNLVEKHRELVLGNSLLVEADPTYPQANRYHLAEHTIERVIKALEAVFIRLPAESPKDPAIQSPPDLFLGYLLMDALIGNTDRHHENWAIIQDAATDNQRRAFLCPSFDHASSLAHVLTDEERSKRLVTKDQGYSVARYVAKARSAFYRVPGDSRPLSPINAFRLGAEYRPNAAAYWLGQLENLNEGILEEVVSRVPGEVMTQTSKDFALAVLACNRSTLLSEPNG